MDMNALLAAASKKVEAKRKNFEPLDLNEGNVQAIYNRCLAAEEDKQVYGDAFPLRVLDKKPYTSKESEEVYLSHKKCIQNKKHIAYLIGQIEVCHTRKERLLSLQEGFYKYDGTSWTKEYTKLFQLYALALKVGYFRRFIEKPDGLILTETASDTPAALSPKDPAFPAWWEAHKAEWEE